MSVFTNRASQSREQAQAYTAAIVGLLGDHDPLEVLRDTERELRRAIEGLPAADLARLEAPGKWSIACVLQHLADSDLVWGWRVRLVLAQDAPTITGYDQDLWAERLRYDEARAEEALDQFRVLRAGNLRLIDHCSPQDLARVGMHSERGEESIAHMMRMYAGHDLLHRRQIERIRGTVKRDA